mmetsp:Transcript_1646/g.2363  ORF Transcript_1646/g.2363 Transcript_1646/m.2363 type:complete len:281 (-) Transcript_1646:100-942(-)
MVFFSCDGCGDVFKKSQVDAHANRCRRCDSVSCADCQVSFYGDDYRKHTSCLTEVERYEKKGTHHQKKKKLSPQEIWMEIVQLSIESAPGHLKHHLQVIADLDNVPRKPKQFKNFAANSLNFRGNSGEAAVSEMWEYLKSKQDERRQADIKAEEKRKESEEKIKEAVKTDADSDSQESSQSSSSQETNPPPKDRKTEKSIEQKDANITPSADPKAVKKAMKTVLKKATDNSLSMKKLKKAVLEHMGLPRSNKKELKRLLKHNISGEKFIIDGKTVTLKID